MKRLILAISVLLVLGLAAAAIAYNRSAVSETATMSCCCCSGDSCPMKKDAAATASCCDDGCCKDGSCAMKKDGAVSADMPADCPMMKKGEASHATMTAEEHQAMQAEGKSCCCACCKDKQST